MTISRPLDVRQFDPDGSNDFNLYDVNFNSSTGELYFRDGETVYSYVVPEPGAIVLLAAALLFAAPRARRGGHPA